MRVDTLRVDARFDKRRPGIHQRQEFRSQESPERVLHMMEPSDGELALRSRHGEREAFLMLVERHGSSVASYLRSRSVAASDVEDLAQEVFVRAFQRMGTLQSLDSFATWLFSIARNLATDWMRSRARRPAHTALDGSEECTDLESADPLFALATRERSDTMRRLIGELPEIFRSTLYLKHLEKYSCDQIARMQGVGVGTVTKRLSRAYQWLRARLAVQERET